MRLSLLGFLFARLLEEVPNDGGGGGGAKTDPAKTDPPLNPDPSKTDPAKTDPAKTDPAKTDPSKTDPAKTDPAKTDPAKTDPAKVGAPEKYEAFQLPEGVELQPAELAEFEGFAREANLTQEQAQKLIAREHTYLNIVRETEAARVKAVQASWREALVADPEVGGPKLEENSALAKKAVATFFPGLKLGEAGDNILLDNPAIFKGLVTLAKQYVKEDGLVPGNTQPKGGSKMYPNSNHVQG